VSTFITTFDTSGDGVRLAVKDLIDMEGVPTTAGSRAVAERAVPALTDAACLAGARAQGARIVGKVNLHELAFGATGKNPWFGTPTNPLDPRLVPGGSSSGSAVAVANGDADVAYGSDTGGSVRIPSACCGTAGLKTTWGRVSLDGVFPLAPSLDTIGPMARDVAGLIQGMELLEPGFAVKEVQGPRVGTLRIDADPLIQDAIASLLATSEWELEAIDLPEWKTMGIFAGMLLIAEAWVGDRDLVASASSGIGADVIERIQMGSTITPDQVASARERQVEWRRRFDELFTRVDFLALPTLPVFPLDLDEPDDTVLTVCNLPVNFAGLPALAVPVPRRGGLPASLQLVGPEHSEERLLSAGLLLEAAAASLA
jgi:amidase